MYTKQIDDKFADRSDKVKQHKHRNKRQASYDISILKQTAEVATGCCASKRHILPSAGSTALSANPLTYQLLVLSRNKNDYLNHEAQIAGYLCRQAKRDSLEFIKLKASLLIV